MPTNSISTFGDGSLRSRVLAGGPAVFVSLALLVSVLVRPRVGLNVANSWTIFLGLGGGVMAVLAEERAARIVSIVMLVLALLPALVGGLGLLYVPSVVLLVRAPAGVARIRRTG